MTFRKSKVEHSFPFDLPIHFEIMSPFSFHERSSLKFELESLVILIEYYITIKSCTCN